MAVKPSIVISDVDLERLERLLAPLSAQKMAGIEELEQELDRADVVSSREIPTDVVTMNSRVRFREVTSGREFELTLVYPRDAGSEEPVVSILAPVGSALLGLAEGEEMEWPRPGGGSLRVRIEEVVYQPERAGEYHR